MKKIITLISSFIFITIIFSGCEDETSEGLVGTDEDLIGTWKTDAGSFTLGDTIRFNRDYSCDFFWSHTSHISANGTWDRTYKDKVGYVIVITLGEIETIFKYDFFDNYKTLRLKLEDSDEYLYYSKQPS